MGLLPSVGKVSARLISENEVGALATTLKVAGVIGTEPNSRVMDGVSIKDVVGSTGRRNMTVFVMLKEAPEWRAQGDLVCH